MAVLSADLLRAARNALERDVVDVVYTKAQIGAAFQAIEDTFENARPTLNTAINNATAPLVLSAAVKKALVRRVLMEKFGRDV